jgi:hypothetical protein
MARIATYAAVAISIAAAIPSGGTSLLGTAALSAGLTASVATATIIASGVALAANLGANMLVKKPSVSGGTQSEWSADPNADVPVLLGRSGVGGNIVYRKGSGELDKNRYQTITTVLSLGPIASYDGLLCDRKPVAFNGAVASGTYFERLWRVKQLGACPESGALNTGVGNKPGWTAAHTISGLAADQVTLLYDAKGKNTFTTEPQMLRLMHGVLAYDPREDSSYPGGSGPQRAGDQTTWQWSANPFVLGLTWALGWRQNGKRRAGVGLRPDQIDIGSFAEAANIADLNGWTVGGQVSTGDDKWEALKAILQAGGGEPVRDGAILSCIVQAPRVSIATIGAGDLIGKASVPRSRPRRERINGIIPKYRSEEHFWEQVSGTVARIADHVAEDGGVRTRELEYPLVQVETGQDVSQPTQLAGYDVELARERMPISLPLKLRWIGYRAGDCISCAIDELGLAAVQLIIIKRALDPATGAVTLTVRTEDPEKHARVFALTGDLPPVNAFQRPDLPSDYAIEPAGRAAYTIVRQTVAYPLDSTADTITVAAFDATIDDGRLLSFPAQTITGLDAGSTYIVLWDLTAQAFVAVSAPALTESASSNFVIIRQMTTQNADGTYPAEPTAPGGDGGGGYGGGGCPVLTARILLANKDRTGPGVTIAAGDIEAGAWVWTQHEFTRAWGAHLVTFTRVFESDLVAIAGRPLTSPSHLWGDGGGWARADVAGEPAGTGKVVALTVADAHTYVLVSEDGARLLSHNKQPTPEA